MADEPINLLVKLSASPLAVIELTLRVLAFIEVDISGVLLKKIESPLVYKRPKPPSELLKRTVSALIVLTDISNTLTLLVILIGSDDNEPMVLTNMLLILTASDAGLSVLITL